MVKVSEVRRVAVLSCVSTSPAVSDIALRTKWQRLDITFLVLINHRMNAYLSDPSRALLQWLDVRFMLMPLLGAFVGTRMVSCAWSGLAMMAAKAAIIAERVGQPLP